jgi:hypothetical protein
MSTLSTTQRTQLDRWLQWSLAIGAGALLVCVIGAPLSPEQFFRSYLAAYLFVLGIPLGCMSILMVYYLTGGAWGFLVRRVLEAAMRTLPLMAILFIPIAMDFPVPGQPLEVHRGPEVRIGGLRYLYPWARPDVVEADEDLQHKKIYLNAPFFWARAGLFFVLWCGIAWQLSLCSRREDETGDDRWSRRLVRLSGPGLVIYGVSITFASIDWVMSLQPAFRSTIFGPVFASGQLISAMAFAVIVMAWLVWRPPLSRLVSADALNDIGSLVFTFLVVWAYVSYFQFMLVWIANLPYDAIFYLPRSRGGWQWVAAGIAGIGFAIPFFCLLMRDVKRDPRSLAQVCGLILFMQLVSTDWQVLPVFTGTTIADHWMDLLAPVGIFGIWLAFFFWQLRRRPVLPRHDVNQESAAHLRHLDEEATARAEEDRPDA